MNVGLSVQYESISVGPEEHNQSVKFFLNSHIYKTMHLIDKFISLSRRIRADY